MSKIRTTKKTTRNFEVSKIDRMYAANDILAMYIGQNTFGRPPNNHILTRHN